MDRLRAIVAFREVARQGGFAAAARSLNLSAPSVSRLIADLEDDIGVRLFTRSTRNVALTEEGEEFLRRGVVLVDELAAVTAELRARRTVPRGHLRVSTVAAFGQELVVPAVPGFLARHPEVTVEVDVSNRKVDLVQEHYDLAIRIGGSAGLEASSLKARKIFAQKLVFVATPHYVARFGAPEALEDLARHRFVKQVSGTWGAVADLRHAGERLEVDLPETFVVNSPNAALNAVMTGSAVGLLADYLVAPMLSDGRMRRVLPSYETAEQPIHAVFVHRNYMPAKVRAFIDHLIGFLDGKAG